MHILFVHQNFPAQFGHIAGHLVKNLGWKCTFVSETPGGVVEGIEKIQYKVVSGATQATHFCSRTFENAVWHSDAVFQALAARPDVTPDLIVGHSGFGSTIFLRELYGSTPIVNFFEYYYRPHDPESDMDFRKDLPWEVEEIKYRRSRARNAMILLDLQNCDEAYTPTAFQKSRFPTEYQSKLRTIFDGVDRSVYHGYGETLRPPMAQRGVRTFAGVEISPTTRIITYVSRGFESMRGFDIFMKSAKLIAERFDDVKFIIVGTDRVAYGGDTNYTAGKSFKDWTLAQQQYDLSKFHFVGRMNPIDLGKLLAATDLHIYLTVPFVLSWSMMDALSCGAVVLGSATSPVKEMIRDGENGLLADFFNPEEFAEKAIQVLNDPDAFRSLGRAAEQMVLEKFSLDAVLPEMLKMYEDARNKPRSEPDHPRPTKIIPPQPVAPTTKAKAVGGKARSPFNG